MNTQIPVRRVGRLRYFSILLATTAFCAPVAALAQAQAPDNAVPVQPTEAPSTSQSAAAPAAASPSAAAQAGPVLSEVVVTADRRNSYGADLVQAGSFRGARQLDTPLTVSVIPHEVLVSQQVRGVLDALRNTAGVTSAQTSPTVYGNLAIRGIAIENRGNYRLNGSLPIVGLIDLPIEDKDRVEALKGASALYYGFTAPSGIINLVMKRPTAAPFGEAEIFGDSNGSAGAHLDAGATKGMVGARVNFVYAGVDSGIDHTHGTRALASGAFDFKPTSWLSFSLDTEYIYKDVPEPGIFLLTAPKSTAASPYPAIIIPPLLDPSTNFGPRWANYRAEEGNILGHMAVKLSDAWAFTFDAGTSQLNRDRRLSTLTPTNLATGAGTLAITLAPDALYKNYSYRGELAGTFYTGPFLHEVLIGASENIRDQFAPVSTKALCPGATATSAPVACAQNFFTPVAIPETLLGPSIKTQTEIDDIGVYGFDRVKFQDWLQLLGGIRYSDYKESNRTTGLTTFKDQPVSYSYGAVVKPRSWISLYGTYIQGLESTPATPITAANAGQQLPATESVQREGGVKVEPRRGFLVQAAYFNIERTLTFINGANVFVQDGRARYEGIETSATGELTRDLSIYASAQFLNAKQVSGSPTIISGTTVSPTSVGKRVENVPHTTASLAAEYHLNRFVQGLSVTAAVYYVGRRAVNPLNEAFIPGYTLFDLGASYRREIFNHPTTFRINAQNVGDKRYWASTGSLFLAEGPPGYVKFSVSTQF